jgi:hypothetical protein
MQTNKRTKSWSERPEGCSPDSIYEEVDIDAMLGTPQDETPLPPFPLDALPKVFVDPVQEVMRHYRVSALLPVTCALVINSAAIGRGLVIKSNVRRTYANLYAIVGAQSGTGKSVVFDEFMDPLNKLQIEAMKEFGAEQKPRAEAELKLLQSEIQSLLKFKKNQKDFSPDEDARHEKLSELLQQQAELEDKLQFAFRLWCVDFTSEALALLLANSNEQIAVLSDEGGLALYNLIGRYTKGQITDDILLCKAKTVNSTAVDRVSRAPIILTFPCVSLLLLVQPDLLWMAFSNERLLIGGFLARCLCADSKLQVQYEDERTLPEADPAIMEIWNQHIRSLVETFRFAEESCWISADPKVREISRIFHNEIVDQIRGSLFDISSFAARWVERAWEISLNLHAGLYGVECYRELLSPETFSNAVRIARYFADRQLEVLKRMNAEKINEFRDKLESVFTRNGHSPVTLRDLTHRYGLDRVEVLKNVKSHPEIYGILKMRRPTGGSPSILIFRKSNPPQG